MGANLQNVNLNQAYLSDANLNKCLMTGVNFGQLPMLKHDDAVQLVLFSNDGNFIATVVKDYIVIWDAKGGQEVARLYGRKDTMIRKIIFTLDSKYLLSIDSNGSVREWDLKTFKLSNLMFNQLMEDVSHADISLNCKFLACVSFEKGPNPIQIWDLNNKQLITKLENTELSSSIVFNADGSLIAVARFDIVLWDIKTLKHFGKPLQGHTRVLKQMIFSSDNKWLASICHSGNEIRLWSIDNQQQVGDVMLGHPESVTAIAFSPDGNYLVSAGYEGAIQIWNVFTQQRISMPLTGHLQSVNSITLSSNGKYLASAGEDTTVKLWKMKNALLIDRPPEGHLYVITSFAFSKDGKYLVSGSKDEKLLLWDVQTRQQIGKSMCEGRINCVAISPDNKFIVSSSKDSRIRFWDVTTQEQIGEPLEGHTDTIKSLVFTPDGKCLISCSRDKTIRIWDIETRTLIGTPLEGHNDHIRCIAVSFDSKYLASGGGHTFYNEENSIRLWDLSLQAQVGHPMEGHVAMLYGLTFSTCGKYLASCSRDKTARLWDAQKQQSIGKPMAHRMEVYCAQFCPNSDYLATNTPEKFYLWLITSQECHRIIDNNQVIYQFLFSSDGKYLVKGSIHGAIEWWLKESNLSSINYLLLGYTGNPNLVIKNATFNEISGLSEKNSKLLKQLNEVYNLITKDLSANDESQDNKQSSSSDSHEINDNSQTKLLSSFGMFQSEMKSSVNNSEKEKEANNELNNNLEPSSFSKSDKSGSLSEEEKPSANLRK
jgi:WD40 repeat protein